VFVAAAARRAGERQRRIDAQVPLGRRKAIGRHVNDEMTTSGRHDSSLTSYARVNDELTTGGAPISSLTGAAEPAFLTPPEFGWRDECAERFANPAITSHYSPPNVTPASAETARV
jgi:hypothetical protein